MNPHIFREYDIRGVIGVDLTPPVVRSLGLGIGSYLAGRGAHRISLGRDGRLSSPDIRDWLLDGLTSAGMNVVDLGVIPTPLSYYSTHKLAVDGAVMITGSHNPPEYNGFKISSQREAIYGAEIQKIHQIIEQNHFVHGIGTVEPYDLIPDYIRDLATRLKPIRPVRIAIDCGNGVAALTAPELLKCIGCEAHVLFEQVDGNFPHHHPDPTVEKNIDELKKVVALGKYELGVAYDGDGDRIGVVDENGKVLWGDQILAILARDVLKERPGATIIGEVKCSQLFFEDIARHNGNPLMWKVGHSLIKSKMHETGAELAGEMSGHIFFHHRFYGFDDAVYVTGRLLEIIAKSDVPLSRMLSDWPPMVNTPEIRIDCPDEIKFQVVEQVRGHFRTKYEVVDVDGMRLITQGGWGLLRASNTQPVLVLRFEAESTAKLSEIRTEVETVLAQVKAEFA